MRTRALRRPVKKADPGVAEDMSGEQESASGESVREDKQHSKFWLHLCAFLGIVAWGFFGVYIFFSRAPELEGTQCNGITPFSMIRGVVPKLVGGDGDEMGTAEKVWHCATAYQEHHPTFVLSAFVIVYVTLQTLAIPGPIVLSVLSGALYDPIPAQALVAFCATTGASLCFTISYFLGNDIVHVLLPGMIKNFRARTEKNKSSLMNYLLFLRLTPLLPNWFVNVASPVVGVPLYKFALATFIGLLPANYFHMQTGRTLKQMGAETSDGGTFTSSFLILLVLQFVPLIPTLFKSRLRRLEQERFGGGAAAAPASDGKAE